MAEDSTKNIDSVAAELSADVCAAITAEPGNFEAHKKELEDLKLAVAREAVSLEEGQDFLLQDKADLLWNIAQNLPDFNIDVLYQKKTTAISLAAAVFIGWLLGGILSGLLNLIGLGGDILRAAAIFCTVWAGEYLSANPRARRILLACIGLGGLARFASMLAGGMIRFTSLGGLRQAIFGAGKSPNIFKSFWMLIGAIWLMIFLSKKISALDITAFRESLRRQIIQDLKLVLFICGELEKRDKVIFEYEHNSGKEAIEHATKKQNQLTAATLGILDALDEDKRAWMSAELANVGVELPERNEDIIIWNPEKHVPLYETVGLVRPGDKCRVLRRAYISNGNTVKGYAQRIA